MILAVFREEQCFVYFNLTLRCAGDFFFFFHMLEQDGEGL